MIRTEESEEIAIRIRQLRVPLHRSSAVSLQYSEQHTLYLHRSLSKRCLTWNCDRL